MYINFSPPKTQKDSRLELHSAFHFINVLIFPQRNIIIICRHQHSIITHTQTSSHSIVLIIGYPYSIYRRMLKRKLLCTNKFSAITVIFNIFIFFLCELSCGCVGLLLCVHAHIAWVALSLSYSFL